MDSRLTTTKGREFLKVIQEKNYSFLSTVTPKFSPTEENKIPDLPDFFVTNGISSTYTDIQSSYDLSSDHSPIIATLSILATVRKSTARMHNSKTNWDTYRQIIQDKVNLSIKIKEREDIEIETNNLLNLIQHAAKEATPNSDTQRPTNNITYEIKKLVAEKRASSI